MNNIRGVEGSLQEMAGQGFITANDMRNAMFMSAGDIEQGFSSAPMTFGQVWTRIMNVASMACQPLLDALNFIADNFSIIAPIIFGVAAAIGFLAVAINWASISYALVTNATKLWVGAQKLLNTVMSLSPLSLVVLGIILLITVIYAVVGAILSNKKSEKIL